MNIREAFPVLNNTTYLNTAGSGILHRDILNWRREHDSRFLEQGSTFRLEQALFIESVKDSVATFFHASREHTYLVPNFSSAFAVLLNGLPEGQRFLLLGSEFPAVYYPVQSRGFAHEMIPQGYDLEQRIIEGIQRFKPTIFIFSMVQYSNGLRLSPDFLFDIKNTFPDLILIADGTQYCGSEPFHFSNSPLDAIMASGYKWMLGGYGNGFALLKPHFAQSLYTAAQHRPLPGEAFLKHKSWLTLLFEPGHQDTLSFGTLQQSMAFLSQTGYSTIAERTQSLAQEARKAFSERGLLDDYIVERPLHSSIFKLNIGDELVQKIQEANITATARGGLRVSFYFYNEKEELDRLLDVIDRNL